MREIKFRAMIDHTYPCYVYPFETKRRTRIDKSVKWVELFGMGCGNGPSWWCEPNGYGSCTRFFGEILKETIGQYTGLKDKNGKEAYEGDIVRRVYDFTKKLRKPKYRIDQVIFKDGAFLLFSEYDNGIRGFHYIVYGGHKVFPWEVIGNIYENPELLKLK